jgi:dihydroorotase
LWSELVDRRGWAAELLWDRLCWGPARFLGLEPEHLAAGSRRWILFDPYAPARKGPSLAANWPAFRAGASGRVVASGFSEPADWPVRAGRSIGTDRSARTPDR